MRAPKGNTPQPGIGPSSKTCTFNTDYDGFLRKGLKQPGKNKLST